MKKMRRAVVLILALALICSVCACGLSSAPKHYRVEGDYNVFAVEVEGFLTEPSAIGIDSATLTLEEGGGGYMTINDDGGDVKNWSVENGNVIVESGVSTLTGTAKDGILILNIAGNDMYYAQEGVDTSSYEVMSTDEFIAAGGQAAMLLTYGKEYLYGLNGTEIDWDMAEQCFTKSADQGNGDAWYYLGKLYELSDRDGKYEEMKKCMDKAVENGSGLGLYGLGRIYEFGFGDYDIDYEKAKDYYQQAVDAGYPEGSNGLGHLYHRGKGVEADGEKALEYYQDSLNGSEFGIVNSALIDMARIYYAPAEGVDQDYEKTLELVQEAMDAGYDTAFYYMGVLYEDGEAVEQDYEKANEYYQMAADLKSGSGMDNLGDAYKNGTGVEADLPAAMVWYEKAAALGNTAAYNTLGVIYSNENYTGGQVELDYAKAMEYFLKGDAGANSKATENVGVMYYSGYGVEANKAEALNWFLKAINEGGEGIAMYLAAKIYQNGMDGVPVNTEEAIRLYKAALESGNLYDSQIEDANAQLAALGG